MSDPQTFAPSRAPNADTSHSAALPLAIAPRTPVGDGLVAGGWDADPAAAIHGYSLDALLGGGAPVAFVLGTRGSVDAMPPADAGTLVDPLGDGAVRPMLIGSSAILVEVAPR